MRVLAGIIIALAVITLPSTSLAGAIIAAPTSPTFSDTDETVASIGLRIEFGDVVKPSVVAAVRTTTTDTSNDVTGALAEVAVPIDPEGDFSPVFRVMGIFGNTDVQGLAGIGYDFGKNQGILGLGAQGDYVDGGLNFGLDGTFSPYVGGSSYDGPPDRGASAVPRT